MAYKCSGCQHVQLQAHQELLACGLWPASPSSERLQYVVKVDTLEEFADLVTHIPKSSMRGFVSMLQTRGERQHGIRV
jgi:CxC3 like cysteine cluster associated with KDZ transposases